MIFLGFFCFILALFRLAYRKSIVDPGFIFNLLWCFVLTMRVINPFHYYELSDETIFVLVVGIISFEMGCLCFDLFSDYRARNNTTLYSTVEVQNDTNIRLLNKIQIGVFFCLLVKVAVALPMLLNGGGYVARAAFSDATGYLWGEGAVATFQRLFYIHLGIMPLNSALAMLSFIYWAEGKMKTKNLIFPLLNGIGVFLISFARGIFINYIMFFVCAFFLKDNSSIDYFKEKKQKRIFRVLIIIFIGAIILNTIMRASDSHGVLLRTISSYFCGGMQMLDICLKNKEQCGLTVLDFGQTTFSGLLVVLTYLFRYLSMGFIELGYGEIRVDYFTGLRYQIGPDTTLNSFPTVFYYFYRDFGILGVVLESFIFAIVVLSIFRKTKLYPSTMNKCKYTIIAVVLVSTSCWWLPYKMDVWMYWIHALWIVRLIEKPSYNLR